MTTSMQRVAFPKRFVFGAATAAYQIEGAVDVDGRGPSVWDTFCKTPGRIAAGATGEHACRHYERLDEDLDLIAQLGLESYRFSVSWPRVQPDPSGQTNTAGLAFYDRLVDGLLQRGVRPSLTLNHWDLPQWLEDQGGWPSRDAVSRFVDYAMVVARHLGDRVPMWTTHNEPWVISWLGYGNGLFAPGVADLAAATAAHHHLLLSHGAAVQALRELLPATAEVGIVLNLMQIYPASDHPDDVAAAALADGHLNRSFMSPLFEGRYPGDVAPFSQAWQDGALVKAGDLEVIATPIDFLGVNSYHPRLVAAPGRLDALRCDGLFGEVDALAFGLAFADVHRPATPRTSMGWPIAPRGFEDLLVRIDRDWKVPIYVTENGASFEDCASPEGEVVDEPRIAYLDAHLRALAAAMARGVDVRGYFAWSLMDNFEWVSGYGKRFGLIYVDYPTGRRIPKSSAAWYGGVIRRHAIDPEFSSAPSPAKRGVER